MAIGTVTQKLRPLRFAFLVDPSDRAALQQAIDLSSAQWGGGFNPIIPAYRKRLPKKWERTPRSKLKSGEVIDGYLSSFDPDFVVPLGAWAQSQKHISGVQCLSAEDLLPREEDDLPSSYGIETVEILSWLVEEDLSYVKRVPTKVLLPSFKGRFATFLSSVFGQLPAAMHADADALVRGRVDIATGDCTIESYPEYLASNYEFPRRICATGLADWWRESTVFCLDATDTLDIIDYWNLRAAGFAVFPVPMQAAYCPAIKRAVEAFGRDAIRHSRQSGWSAFTVQVGRSLQDAVVQNFLKGLNFSSTDDSKRPLYLLRSWYPRLWDRWAQENTDERPRARYAEDKDTQLTEIGESVEVPVLCPPFIERRGGTGRTACVANEVAVRTYGTTELMADVLPPAGKELTDSILRYFHHFHARISQTGLVVFNAPHERTFRVPLARAHEVLSGWFSSKQWKTNLSSSGRIATQILRQIGGRYGLFVLCREPLLNMLDKHASERADENAAGMQLAPRWINESALLAELSRMLKQEGAHITRDQLLKKLLDWKVIHSGLQLQCRNCTRRVWKRLGLLEDQVECDHCGAPISVATSSPNERAFSYRPFGPFGVRDSAGGAYSVLMTLLRLSDRTLDRRMTAMLSFEATPPEGPPLEVDLAMLCQESSWRNDRRQLVFSECKAYDEIGDEDVARMTRLAEAFPGSLLIFSKMAPRFSAAEVVRLRKFSEKQRRLEFARKPHCRVMLLTGVELFSHERIPECWKDLPSPHAEAGKHWSQPQSLLDDAEATEMAYLGLKPRSEVYRERWQRMKSKSVAKAAG